MTRKKRDFSRPILPDPKYGDIVLAKTMNVVMRNGKKCVAEKALYGALDVLQEKLKADPLESFRKALSVIEPVVEVRSRRVGGATYQVPSEVSAKRGQALAIRWLVQYANARSERTLAERLAGELMDALQGRGGSMKKREDTHRIPIFGQ